MLCSELLALSLEAVGYCAQRSRAYGMGIVVLAVVVAAVVVVVIAAATTTITTTISSAVTSNSPPCLSTKIAEASVKAPGTLQRHPGVLA